MLRTASNLWRLGKEACLTICHRKQERRRNRFTKLLPETLNNLRTSGYVRMKCSTDFVLQAFLRMAIFTELKEWNQRLQEKQCPFGATEFSFWVITILPFSDDRRLQMLRLESAVERLRYELQLLREVVNVMKYWQVSLR